MYDKEEIYYVYIYLDPRKPGKFNYGEYVFDYEPFYIGKGKGLRMYKHLSGSDNYNNLKNNKIKKLLKLGIDPIVLKVKDNINEEKALLLEKNVIKTIGRKCIGDGPLLNIQEGGNMPLWFEKKKTDAQKKAAAKSLKEHNEKMKSDDEYKNKCLEKKDETMLDRYGTTHISGTKGAHLSDETKNTLSSSLKSLYKKDEEYTKSKQSTQLGKVWIHNKKLKKSKFSKREKLDFWLEQGWEMGRNNEFGKLNKVWIHNKNLKKTKRVNENEIDNWLSEGWERGRHKLK